MNAMNDDSDAMMLIVCEVNELHYVLTALENWADEYGANDPQILRHMRRVKARLAALDLIWTQMQGADLQCVGNA